MALADLTCDHCILLMICCRQFKRSASLYHIFRYYSICASDCSRPRQVPANSCVCAVLSFFCCWKSRDRQGFQDRVKLAFLHVFTKNARFRHRKGGLPKISSQRFPRKIRPPTAVVRSLCRWSEKWTKWPLNSPVWSFYLIRPRWYRDFESGPRQARRLLWGCHVLHAGAQILGSTLPSLTMGVPPPGQQVPVIAASARHSFRSHESCPQDTLPRSHDRGLSVTSPHISDRKNLLEPFPQGWGIF